MRNAAPVVAVCQCFSADGPKRSGGVAHRRRLMAVTDSSLEVSMRVFLTGATGFIGSRIVTELIGAGHQVLGLARSDNGAQRLEKAGAEVLRGMLKDTDIIARGAVRADAVIHTAFDHDFSRYAENCEKDRRAIRAMGAVLAGSDRPFIVTSVIGMGITRVGAPAIEQAIDWHHAPRAASEQAAAEIAAKGVSVAVVRLPQVHDTVKQGLITWLIDLARTKGVSAYVGDGANRWPAAHVTDVARLYRLALERHEGAHAITRSPRKVCRCVVLPTPSAPDSARRWCRCRRPQRRIILAGWQCSPGSTCRHRAHVRGNASAGNRPVQVFSPTSADATTVPRRPNKLRNPVARNGTRQSKLAVTRIRYLSRACAEAKARGRARPSASQDTRASGKRTA